MAMTHTIISVTYEIDSQNAAGSFTVPEPVCGFLGIDKGSWVHIDVTTASGDYGTERKQLVSDRQPSPVGDMSGWMRPYERIRVTVSKAT